jgi:uncharacterized repeat protein (TIGR03803 family)
LGTIFELNTKGGLNTLVTLSLTNGAFPVGLAQATNGNLFGATFAGGSKGLGTVFEIPNRSGSLNVLASFAISNGSNPDAPLVIGSDGLVYGTTLQGGADGQGLVFQIATNIGKVGKSAGTNTALSAEDSLDASTGACPQAGLLQAKDGNFYGTTTSGGANGTGTVFGVLGFAPTILSDPTNLSFALNKTANFSVQAGGSSPLFYQWRFGGANLTNGGNISGATSNLLTLSPEALTDPGNYSVIVSNAYGVVTSSVAELTVPVPTLTIKTPPASVTSNSLIVTGTAADKYGLTNVFYRVNSGTNWLSALSTNHWTNWYATVTWQGGSNSFSAYSVDLWGNPSPTSTVEVFYLTTNLLTLSTTGFGTISPKVASTNLVVDRPFTVTAKPANNNLFSNWTGTNLTGTFTSISNPLTFLMVSNMSLTANFVTNPFLKANVSGPYNGLFFVSNAVGAQSSGMIQNLKVTSPGTGAYTSKLYYGGTGYSLNGAFDVAGNASNQITPTSSSGTLTVAMNLNWNTNPPQITGTVSGRSGGAWTASLLAELAGTNLPSAAYTMLIPTGTNSAVESPPGYGYATITNTAGSVKITGALADGAALIPTVVAESASSNLAVYATPYSNGGLLTGWLTVSNGAPEGSLTWIKPAASTGLFPNGYTNIVTVQSSPWSNPPPHTAAISLTNGQLQVWDALTLPLLFDVSVSTNNTLVENVPSSAPYTLTGSISKTGLLIVSIPKVGGETITGSGVVLQNQTNGAGYFVTKTNAGIIILH